MKRSTPSRRRATAPTAALRSDLLGWYRTHRRDLPWRRSRDPYAIWVSEIMLQQTQVATVLPYYRRFLDRFPDPATLARASEEEVLSAWSGLGYYRRARALHESARQVTARHAGRLPADPQALRRLPGIGRYTAGAIASIAFDLCEPVLDGNVRRVLVRLFAVASGPGTDRRLWQLAGDLVRGPEPGNLNQALMELGALVCRPADPNCAACPVAGHCRGRSRDPLRHPAPRPRRASERVRVAVAVVRRSGRMLLERPRRPNPLRGRWDLPAAELPARADASASIRSLLRRRHALVVRVEREIGRAAHGIMHRRLELEIHDCRLGRGRVAGNAELRWLDPLAIDSVAVSGATRKVLRILSAGR